MAVMMLGGIEPGWVPDLHPQHFLPVEMASMEDLWFSANEVIHSCIYVRRRLGWHEEGKHLSKHTFGPQSMNRLHSQALTLTWVYFFGQETRTSTIGFLKA